MNAGLSNLATLKNFLLAQSLQINTSYDAAKILPIGLGIAGLMNTYCGRNFGYNAAAVEIFSGDRPHWYLSFFPVLSVASVSMRYFITDAWTNISGEPIQWNQNTGLLSFGYTLGRFPLQIQVCYAGGFTYEQLEPTDEGYPTQQPAGTTPLPPDVQLAWLLQCAEVWNKIDKLGAGIATEPDKFTLTGALKLSDGVKEILQPYRRLQMS